MDIKKLNECIEMLKDDMGESLLATSIVTISDGQAIADYTSSPGAAAIFTAVTEYLVKALASGPYPELGKYYLLDLEDDKMLVFLPLGEYQWGIAIDSRKAKLGLLLNVIMPKMVEAFEEALTAG